MNNWLKNNLFSLRQIPCLLCGIHPAAVSGLCPACLHELPENNFCCPSCAAPLTDPDSLISSSLEHIALCGACLKAPPFFNLVHAPYLYAPPLSKLITELKFGQRLHHARVLGHLLLNQITKKLNQDTDMPNPQCLIAVPLHPKRLRERGYNQALEIARPLAKSLAIKLENNLCQRVKHTPPQTDLKLKDRRVNLRHAFHINTIKHYRHIAIIDDVITTGQTVQELARVFRLAGVETIEVWAVARVKLGK